MGRLRHPALSLAHESSKVAQWAFILPGSGDFRKNKKGLHRQMRHAAILELIAKRDEASFS